MLVINNFHVDLQTIHSLIHTLLVNIMGFLFLIRELPYRLYR